MSEESSVPLTWRKYIKGRPGPLKDKGESWKDLQKTEIFRVEKACKEAFKKEKIPDFLAKRGKGESRTFQSPDDRRSREEKYGGDYYEL